MEAAALHKLGEALAALRRQRGLTLEEVGRVVDCHASAISRIENGRTRPKLETLGQLLDALGADVLELGLALRLAQGRRGADLDLPPGLSERERRSLTLAASAFRDFVESVARRFDAAPEVSAGAGNDEAT